MQKNKKFQVDGFLVSNFLSRAAVPLLALPAFHLKKILTHLSLLWIAIYPQIQFPIVYKHFTSSSSSTHFPPFSFCGTQSSLTSESLSGCFSKTIPSHLFFFFHALPHSFPFFPILLPSSSLKAPLPVYHSSTLSRKTQSRAARSFTSCHLTTHIPLFSSLSSK